MEHILVDTGFLVALARARDPAHSAAVRYLEDAPLSLATVSAVVVETCHFLSADSRAALLHWLATDGPNVIEVPRASYPDLARTIERHADRDIDFADAALVWLAEQTGNRKVLTVDVGDFSRFRLKGSKRLEIVDWLEP